MAGATLGKEAITEIAEKSELQLGQRRFTLQRSVLSFGTQDVEGKVEDISDVTVQTVLIQNGVRKTAIELREGVKKYKFGAGLSTLEHEWLVSEIRDFLDSTST